MSLNKDLIIYLINSFDVKNVNWAFQMKLANALLSKYNFNEIKYALDYYKDKGEKLTSLGFLSYKNNMKDPVSLYHAELHTSEIKKGDKDRNKKRIEKSKQYVSERTDLFE